MLKYDNVIISQESSAYQANFVDSLPSLSIGVKYGNIGCGDSSSEVQN